MNPFGSRPDGTAPMPGAGAPPGPGGPAGPGGFEPSPAAGGQAWDGGGVPMSPPPAPPKKGKGLLILVIVLVVVVLAGGGAGWYFFLGPGKSSSDTSATGKASPSATASGEVKAAGVQQGDCVLPPKSGNSVTPAKCSAKGALKVVKRLDGTTNADKCPKPETNYQYKFTSYKDSSKSFVLCLATQGGK